MDGSIGGGGFVVMVEKLDLTVFDKNKVHSVEKFCNCCTAGQGVQYKVPWRRVQILSQLHTSNLLTWYVVSKAWLNFFTKDLSIPMKVNTQSFVPTNFIPPTYLSLLYNMDHPKCLEESITLANEMRCFDSLLLSQIQSVFKFNIFFLFWFSPSLSFCSSSNTTSSTYLSISKCSAHKYRCW